MAKSRQQLRQEQRKGVNKQNSKSWIYVIVAVILVAVIGIMVYFAVKPDKTYTTSSNGSNSETDNALQNETIQAEFHRAPQVEGEHDKALFVMENGEEFTVELYPEYAPETVDNFIELVENGFYDGVCFHRVVEGFMAQGGDPTGTGMGGSDKQIRGEFFANGFSQNTLSHDRGVISMARSMDPNSASSQFFICYDDASFLDGNYAAFGKVIEGMDVVDGFLNVERKPNSMGEIASPVEPIVMEEVTIVED